MRNEDCLTVSFDKDPKGRDKTILLVWRKTQDGFFIEKLHEDEQAEKLYKALLGEIKV